MTPEQEDYYFNSGFLRKIYYYLQPEDFLSGCPRYINPDKTGDLTLYIFFVSYVVFLLWVWYMTNRKKGLPSWYPRRLNLKADVTFTYSLVIASTPLVGFLSMWVASFLRRILMFAGCW